MVGRPFAAALLDCPSWLRIISSSMQGRPRRAAPTCLLPMVFPVSGFSLGHPLDRRFQPFLTGLVAPGFGYPIDIFFLVGVAEPIERSLRFLVLLERRGKVSRDLQLL